MSIYGNFKSSKLLPSGIMLSYRFLYSISQTIAPKKVESLYNGDAIVNILFKLVSKSVPSKLIKV